MPDDAEYFPYKVPRVAHRHGFEDILDDLERRWTGKGSESTSLRALAREFNLTLFEEVLEEHEMTMSEPEMEATYETLRNNAGTDADRTRVRRHLEREGIDVDQLQSHFVTHQAIHTYLTEDRGLTKPSSAGRSTDQVRDTVERLRGRLVRVLESELESLGRNPEFTIGEADPIVTITVNCARCHSYKDFDDLLDESGCDCER